jgi:beta-glucosidase
VEHEGGDRAGLGLAGDQDRLVAAVAAANPDTVVVLNAGGPVATPWVDDVAALLTVWFPGEAGAAALADVLVGVADPGGRLPVTFPARLEDLPVAGGFYPGVDGKVVYGEGPLVGYRHYEAHGLAPAFPFGHGLSYTSFELGEPVASVLGTDVRITVDVANVGDWSGVEVVQLYLAGPSPVPDGADHRLVAFAKVHLPSGASSPVALDLDEQAFRRWDPAAGGWAVKGGTYELRVGRSSRHIEHRCSVDIKVP